MSFLIQDGRILTGEADYRGDIYIEDDTISMLGESLKMDADRVIDAEGKYVMPGCVDVHTHLGAATVGVDTCDDFTSGTVAAAFGGTTTIVDFVEPGKAESIQQGLENWHGKLSRHKPVVDVGFHMIVRAMNESVAEELRGLDESGVTSLKLFMAYKGDLMVDDQVLFETMQLAAQSGSLVMVHAENGDVIDVLVRKSRDQGKLAPRYHAETRPPLSEAEAVQRAIHLSQLADSPLYVVHISCAEVVELIAAARSRGQQVWGETCTQYLFFGQSDLDRPDFEGAKYVFSPPPRTKADRERLWEALADDVLSVVSTDHFGVTFESKMAGHDDFSKIPNGAGGVEERLMMIHHHGVGEGRISLNRMVELLATNPAKLLGLYPRKGSIAVGADADLVIFDPEKELTISASNMHSRSDFTMYEGYKVRGVPELVLVRGKTVVEAGELVAEPGHGRFIHRARVGQQLESGAAIGAG